MNKRKRLRLATTAAIKLAKVMKIKLGSVETDKGTLSFVDGEELAVGIEVYITGEDGQNVMPEDGEYKFGNQIAVIKDGIVEEIKDAEALEGETPAGETPETPEAALDAIVEIIEEAAATIEENVTTVEENLRKELSDNIKRIDATLSEIKKVLDKAKLTSKAEFAAPNPKSVGETKGQKGSRAADELKKFGL